jgi:hypothetical protein
MTDIWCDKLGCKFNERINKSYFWGVCQKNEVTYTEGRCEVCEEAESVSV